MWAKSNHSLFSLPRQLSFLATKSWINININMVAFVSTLLAISLLITPSLSSPVKRAVNPAPLALGSTCLYSIVGGATLTLGAGAVLNAITISGTGVSPPTYAAVNNIGMSTVTLPLSIQIFFSEFKFFALQPPPEH